MAADYIARREPNSLSRPSAQSGYRVYRRCRLKAATAECAEDAEQLGLDLAG